MYEPSRPFQFIATKLVAFHLGGWRADTKESVAFHYARGAGWESQRAMAAALRDPGSDAWNEKHLAALRRMFGARGADLDGDPDKRELVMLALIDEADKAGMILDDG